MYAGIDLGGTKILVLVADESGEVLGDIRIATDAHGGPEAVIARIPPPRGDPAAPLKALIIDSWFDNYVGVVMLVRVVDGQLSRKDKVLFMSTRASHLCEQVGVFTPKSVEKERLSAGEVGFVVAGVKELKDARVGDTITLYARPALEALPGFKQIKPQVFAGLYPVDANEYDQLRDALEGTWREDRYLRAIHDDGTEIGVKGSGVWEIDALTAAWAVMTGINPTRGRIVFDTALGILEKETTILLGWPPLREDTKPYLGRSSAYPPGVRENGMYCHGVQWLVGAARLLAEQFERFTKLEQEIMTWLAIEREVIGAEQLQANLLQSPLQRELLERLRALRRRSLLERGETGFTLQNVVMEYVTDRLVETVSQVQRSATHLGRTLGREATV